MALPPGDDEASERAAIAALVERGDYAEAARRLRSRGDLASAQALLERVWDFAGAAEVARARGDRVARLALLLEANAATEAAAQGAEILASAGRDELVRAAEVMERRRRHREAALLRERAGDAAIARELFARAGEWLEAARLDEAAGRSREAGAAYERALSPIGATGGALSPRDRIRAHAGLGRALATLGRHEAAARSLQAALRDSAMLDNDSNRAAAPDASESAVYLDPSLTSSITDISSVIADGRRRLVVCLAALGMDEAARAVLAPISDEPLATFVARARAEGGERLGGRYDVLGLLGSGGMSTVYLARDRTTLERVAVKVVAPPIDERARAAYQRFLREAEVMQRVAHPNVVALREVRADEGLLVMELLPGGTLEARLPLPPPQALAVAAQVARGLLAAHARGVIHRDVKPANVFFDAAGQAKLGDFGVAHLQDLGATQTAGFIGTLAYMAPEQVTGAPLTVACDVYSLGVTLFQALTGRLPFAGPDFASAHLSQPPPVPSSLRAGLPEALDHLVLTMLQKDPAMRFRSIEELLRAIEELQRDPALPGARDGAAPAVSREPEPPRDAGDSRERPRYRVEATLSATPISRLVRAIDERLGRAVLVETIDAASASGERVAAAERWLSAMARHGGPHLARVLRLAREPGPEDGVVGDAGDHAGGGPLRAVHEAVTGADLDAFARRARSDGGPSDSRAARVVLDVLRALAGPHRDGVAHGALERAILVDEAGAATVTIAGLVATRDERATTATDLAALAGAVERAFGVSLPDREATALAEWARATLARTDADDA